MGDKIDVVKIAKSIASLTNLPLPKVAAIMQKYPVTKEGFEKSFEECEKLSVIELKKQMKKINPFA